MNLFRRLLPVLATALVVAPVVATAAEPATTTSQEAVVPPSADASADGSEQDGAAASGPFAALEMLKLRSGGILWGEFVEHDPEAFVVHRLDTSGVAKLPWSMLDPAQELEFKRRFGYVELEQEEISVDASVIPLVDGSTLIGVIELETPDALHVKSSTGILVLPRSRVSGTITSLRVPARDIYSRQELYERKRAELLPGLLATGEAAAKANLELARHCEQILDYIHAVEHYEAALAAGADDPQIEGWLESAQRRAAAQSQVDSLDEIDRLRRKADYPEAMRELEVFRQAWPVSPLMEDWSKLRQRVMKDREKDCLRIARDRWFYWLSRYTRDAAKNFGFQAAQDWADESLGQQILAQVTADVQVLWPEISPAEVKDLFDRRTGSRTRGATFGAGTFLLGKERATKTYDEKKDDEAPDPLSGLAQQRQDIQERMEKFLQSRRASGGAQAESQVDPEEYWKNWNVSGRQNWLISYYAEYGGDVELVRVTVEPHAECGGTGFIEIMDSNAGGGGVRRRLVPDPGCNGVGVKRRVKYK
ncbi:MAG: hypothetical protein R3F34_07970 [Planctomycetota bacterium]